MKFYMSSYTKFPNALEDIFPVFLRLYNFRIPSKMFFPVHYDSLIWIAIVVPWDVVTMVGCMLSLLERVYLMSDKRSNAFRLPLFYKALWPSITPPESVKQLFQVAWCACMPTYTPIWEFLNEEL